MGKTIHVLPGTAMREGETVEAAFRRLALEKPNPDQAKLCHFCGQDHRGPIEFWPAAEREAHYSALRYMEATR